MNDIVWLTMRRLRTPLIVMILVFFSSTLLMVMMPGVNAAGEPVHMSFLNAFYFVAIMSTTIGLGEIPEPFTNAQRFLVFCMILPNVVAWLYSIGTILSLVLDPQFRAVLHRARFASNVRGMAQPFYLLCGFGNTGSMVVGGLLDRGLNAVVLERDANTVHRMILDETFSRVPALDCDTTDRRNLELAGLNHEFCRGVIVTTNDDHANLTIAISSKLLKPDLPVFARSETERISANMRSFGTDYVINPYRIFAERLFLALTSPIKYLVQDWLISVPGSQLRELLEPPTGRWIVCGAGRFGSRMIDKLKEGGLPYTVVEVHSERLERYAGGVLGRGTEPDALVQAGVEDAVGIIAATGDDVDNLSIVMTALALNPRLFVVARQERQVNDALFDASGAHLVARRSLIVARRILAVATTPLLQTFLQHLVREDDEFARNAAARLQAVLHDRSPSLWLVDLCGEAALGVTSAREWDVPLNLGHLTHNSRSEGGEGLPCVCLVLERGAQRVFLPGENHDVKEGDRLLFAGRRHARREMLRSLMDPCQLVSYASGRHMPRSAVWRWLSGRRKA
jgi:Trk K+ transport system NAD-binding subunit